MLTSFEVNDKKYSLQYPSQFSIQNQINEMARKRWYEAPMPEVGTVIDAGACFGVYSLYMSEFAKNIYAIEPQSAHYDLLATNILDNKRQNIKPYKLALSGMTGDRYMYTSYNKEDTSAYSLLPVGEKSEVVKTKTIAQFMKDEKIDTVSILKTDIEGLEQEVFSADDFGDVAPKILCITGEYHIQCVNLKEVLEYHGYSYSQSPDGMYTAVRRLKMIDPFDTVS